MRVMIYRSLKEEEKQGIHPIAKLIKDEECKKITLSIAYMNSLPYINSITIDNKTLLVDEYKDINFFQVFED